MNKRGHAQSGFTLIELMITVAVVGILATVAYPSYQSALIKNRRAAAQVLLSDLAQRQQQFLMDNRAYAGTAGATVPLPAALNMTVPSDVSSYYTITVTLGTASLPSFIATATPLAGSAQVSDGPLSISSDGTKLPIEKW